MIKNCLTVMLLLSSFVIFSKENFTIEGQLLGAKDGSLVEVVVCNFEESTLISGEVLNEKVVFNLKDEVKEGVYVVRINYISGKLNLRHVYQFYIIIDKTENKLSFEFDPAKSSYPNILISNINNNWYNFLKLEDFRVKVINEVKNSIEFKNSNLPSATQRLKEILDIETKELIEIRSKYLKDNYNKWSTAMVRNKYNSLYHKNSTKENYWDQFETQNLQLINTPIYQELIMSYLLLHFKNVDENGYKVAFEKIIEVFSINLDMKNWVVKYLFAGLSTIKNENLLSYFDNKYHLNVKSIME
ncbi:hypothetical protein [Flavobacterium sp.]|uniref:hypothetical protein n=1 Tax=Flavobacterium sp. TaxID=239 RepID=UPI000EBAEB1E|nr:hypothetical protein [Flavobacterium sp.]HCQ13880.1 hypothetical protein [Flavobacterium sp.]